MKSLYLRHLTILRETPDASEAMGSRLQLILEVDPRVSFSLDLSDVAALSTNDNSDTLLGNFHIDDDLLAAGEPSLSL